MRDMNFFAPFLSAGKGKKRGNFLKLVLAVVVIGIVLTPIAIFGLTYMANSRTAAIQEILRTPENVAVMATLDQKQMRLDAINKVLPELQGKDQALQSVEWFTEELLQLVIDTLPKQVRMTGMNLVQAEAASGDTAAVHGFEMLGTALDKPAVAELEQNIRKTGRFNNIFVATMDNDEGTLYFSIKFNVKEVNAR